MFFGIFSGSHFWTSEQLDDLGGFRIVAALLHSTPGGLVGWSDRTAPSDCATMAMTGIWHYDQRIFMWICCSGGDDPSHFLGLNRIEPD